MAELHVTEFTDPACPWAWSAEPFRHKLLWEYGDALSWTSRMVVLASDPADYGGFTPEMLTAGLADIARDHGMPIDTSERTSMEATEPACRAVVGARLNDPGSDGRLLRALRVRGFALEPLDAEDTVRHAAQDARLDPDAVVAWMGSDEAHEATRDDMHAARHPTPAALAQDGRLAGWEGGRRYTCPSLELVREADGAQLSAPGFQPYMAYEMAFANLLPEQRRRAAPGSVAEVLEWAGEPLATREVAVVCGLSDGDAREQLGRAAAEHPLGTDSLWSLR